MNKYKFECEEPKINRIKDAGVLAGFVGVMFLMTVDLDRIFTAVGL